MTDKEKKKQKTTAAHKAVSNASGNVENINTWHTYSGEELLSVDAHISRYWTNYFVLYEPQLEDGAGKPVSICIQAPTEAKPYYTLLTVGAGSELPAADSEQMGQRMRVEFLLYMPPDWLDGIGKAPSEEDFARFAWPLRYLREMVYVAYQTWGSMASNRLVRAHEGSLLRRELGFAASLVLKPQLVEDEAESCVLPNGEKVYFRQLIPLRPCEAAYGYAYGVPRLVEGPLQSIPVAHFTKVGREDTCAGWPGQFPIRRLDSKKNYGVRLAYVQKAGLPFEHLQLPFFFFIYWAFKNLRLSKYFMAQYAELWDELDIKNPKTFEPTDEVLETLLQRLTWPKEGMPLYWFNDKAQVFLKTYLEEPTAVGEELSYWEILNFYACEYWGSLGERLFGSHWNQEGYEYLYIPYQREVLEFMENHLELTYLQWEDITEYW